MFRIPSQVGVSYSINLQFNYVPWEWRCTTEIFWYQRRCHSEQRSVMSETSSSTCCCGLIKMQYTEQDVCRQVTGRFLASRKEGQTKAGRRDNLGWKRRSEEESGSEDTPFVLGRQNAGNTALHEQVHSTCRQISQPDSSFVSKQLYRTSRAGSQFKVGARMAF
jgi:hypothetical protein